MLIQELPATVQSVMRLRVQGKSVLLDNHRTARESHAKAGLNQEAAFLYYRKGVSPERLPCSQQYCRYFAIVAATLSTDSH